MGIQLTGDKAQYTGFIFEDPTVFFFVEGEEVCFWDPSSDREAGFSLAVAMYLFYAKGTQIALDYVNGEPHALLPDPLPRL